MSDGFAKLPPGAQVQPTPYQVSIADDKVDELKQLVKLGRVGPPTYESTQHEHNYGVSHQWLTDAKAAWIDFDWYVLPPVPNLHCRGLTFEKARCGKAYQFLQSLDCAHQGRKG